MKTLIAGLLISSTALALPPDARCRVTDGWISFQPDGEVSCAALGIPLKFIAAAQPIPAKTISTDGCNTCTGSTCTLMACDSHITLTPWRGAPALRPVIAADPAPAAMPAPDLDAPGRSLIMDEGEITPFRGVLLDEQEDRSRERARVRATVSLEEAMTNAWISKPLLAVFIVSSIILGGALGAGFTAWALKK